MQHSSAIVENCSSVTTIKRSKANETIKHTVGDKNDTNSLKLKKMSEQINESLYATQTKIIKKKKAQDELLLNSEHIELNGKSETLMKYKMKSKEELKNPSNFKLPLSQPALNKHMPGIKRKATAEKAFNENALSKKSLDNQNKMKQSKKKKMSEETYLESKSSLTNVMKKKRKSLIGKKWRREVKQQIDNENMFKRSKEKKLDFSINESPMTSNKNYESNEHDFQPQSKLRKSVSKIRNELIQDDSEDEQYESRKQRESIISNTRSDNMKGDFKLDTSSYDSNPLQRIIEQRMMESSSDSEESEEELDDDYDIGIDDIDLGSDDDEAIHTATEDDEENILNESLDSKINRSSNYHKKKLKEALAKGRDASPFTDVIEKGLASYMNNGFKREVRLKNTIKRPDSKTKINKLHDYQTNEIIPKDQRSSSQAAIKRPSSKKNNKRESRKKLNNALGLSNSFDESPRNFGPKRFDKKIERDLEEVRKDHIELNITPFMNS